MPTVFQKIEKFFEVSFVGVFVINIGWLAASIFLSWPQWWVNINYERSPLTWFSSLQLAAIGLTFLILCLMESQSLFSKIWFLMGMCFFGFSFDERFQIHEKLRDKVFKPHDIGTHLPGIGPGDFLFVVIALVGTGVFLYLIRYLKRWPSVLFLFSLAVLSSAVATYMDAQPIQVSNLYAARLEQFWEEIFETIAQMFFLSSALRLLHYKWLENHGKA